MQWSLSSDLCGNFSDQIIIDVSTEPNPDAGNNQEICDNFTNLNANNPESNETGLWTIISGSGSFDDPTNPSTLITDLSEGENILQWSLSSDLCGVFSSTMSINYINSNITVNAGQNLQICEDNIGTLFKASETGTNVRDDIKFRASAGIGISWQSQKTM